MYYLVDVNMSKEANDFYYGIYCDNTNTLLYYTNKEIVNNFLGNNSIVIKGITKDIIVSKKYDKNKFYVDKPIIQEVNFISFNDQDHSKNFPEGMRIFGYYKCSYLSLSAKTILNKLVKITKYVEGLNFWYKGIHITYKNRKKGFIVDKTENWLKDGMTNEKFIFILNELSSMYPIVGFYRTLLAYCKSLDLTGLKNNNISILREFAWHNNSLRYVNMGYLDLSKIVDADKIFHGDSNLQIIDMRNCKNDIDINSNLTFVCGNPKKGLILLLPKTAPNLLKIVTTPKRGYCVFKYFGSLSSAITYEDLLKKMDLYKAKFVLLENNNNSNIKNFLFCFTI